MIQGIHSFMVAVIGIYMVVLVIVTIVSGMVYIEHQMSPVYPIIPVACTLEAKLCPDGSYVGRRETNCEFAKCPNVIMMGTIKGKVTVGPICPVEQEGVPCLVPPEAYTSREVILYKADGVTIVKRMHFLSDGTYSFEILPGTYILNIPQQGIGGSSDLPKTITIKSGETIEVDFSVDTGIR